MEQTQHLEQAVAERGELLMQLYKKAFPVVAGYVARMGGSFDEAKDIFQDALVIYYEKVVAGGLALTGSPKAYLVGTAKHLWLRKFRENNQLIDLDDSGAFDLTDVGQQQPLQNKLMHLLETAGQKCMDLLRSFYYDNLDLAEIAPKFGFSGTRSATVQKYKCLEKVRETIKQKALQYEDFVD